jgi:hypothetical protein
LNPPRAYAESKPHIVSMPERFLKNTDSGAHERAVRILQFAENREVIGANYRKNPRLSPAPSFPPPFR